MANTKISSLTAGSAIADTDVFPAVETAGVGPVTKLASQIKSYLFGKNGAASAPPVSVNGTWFSGGTATTTKPQALVEPTGTASAAWSTSGTGLGVNAPSGFVGYIADFQLAGVSKAFVRYDGFLNLGGGIQALGNVFSYGSVFSLPTDAVTFNMGASSDLTLSRKAAANIRLGAADVAAPIAQTLSVQSVVAGTSNTASGNFTLQGAVSTGSGVSGDIIIQTGGTGAGATAQNAQVTALTIKGATQQALFAGSVKTLTTVVASLPSAATAGAGARAFVTDGTAPTFGATVVGGGAISAPVYSDGAAWKVG